MEEERQKQEVSEYQPRPKWQVILAWVGIAVFAVFLILYYTVLFRGGQ